MTPEQADPPRNFYVSMTANEQAELLKNFHAFSRQPPATHIAQLKKEWKGKDGQQKRMVLDYVGHADATDILLTCDPFWNWEPPTDDELRRLGYECALIRDAAGWPRGLWIALTVHGVRRLGFGTCEPNKPDAIKELIGDAIRNASMRFGLALALWSKAEWDETPPLLSPEAPPLPGELTDHHYPSGAIGTSEEPSPDYRPAMILCRELGLPDDLRHEMVRHITDLRTQSVKEMDAEEFKVLMNRLLDLKNGKVVNDMPDVLKQKVVKWLNERESQTKTPASSN